MKLLGLLTLKSIPLDNPIQFGAFAGMMLAVLALIVLVTVLKKWKYLWDEWFTTMDHKKIGTMYIIVALVMGIRGFADVVMMRSQLAVSYGSNYGYLPPYHYDQVFSAHGTIMIFFFAMPLIIGLINVAVPLQIGTRDVAFPFMNSVSLWLFVVGVVLINLSLGIGDFSHAGWVGYPPLSEPRYSPGVGVDYYIWSLEIAGASTLMTGINFFVTIIKQRAPGMTLMKMPVFTWTALGTNMLIIGAFPILTVVLGLLAMDRYLGTHFFTNTGGGNMMMYVNLFWAWGHPEVYILVLPAFGVFSEVVATFSSKRLFGYTSMIYATMAITIISYMVWLHHFFVMGNGGTVNAVFGISTMIIAIPTGVKIFNWLFTMYRGRIRFTTPMLMTVGFIITFVVGGMSGVLLAVPPADFVLHNSQLLIAHFHNVIIGGTVFGTVAGVLYWFPKIYGFRLNDKIGKWSFGFFFTGFWVTFVPLYIAGLMGMTRRINHYNNPAFHLPMIIAAIGVGISFISVALFVYMFIEGFIKRNERRDVTGDAWGGRTLEWSVSSPPPHYNFAVIPTVSERDAFWEMKKNGERFKPKVYEDIHLPKNSPAGLLIGFFNLLLGFGLIWHIWWMTILGFVGFIVVIIVRTSSDNIYYYLPAEEARRHDEEHLAKLKLAAQTAPTGLTTNE